MSVTEEVATEDVSDRILTAEYKDGQLQIVEVIPLDRNEERLNEELMPSSSTAADQTRYMQVMDPEKGLVQIDLLNLALLKCQDGNEGSYKLVANSKTSESDGENDTTITCVLQSSDGEEVDNDSYVVVEGEQGQMMLLQSALAEEQDSETITGDLQESETNPTPLQLLEKAKAIQRARAQLLPSKKRGRKRKGTLPSPHELLSSPNFKLYLYSCRSCDFKCNAVKELTKHRAEEHAGGSIKYRIRNSTAMQCAHCPYRANLYSQLENHMREKHKSGINASKSEAKVLHCAKCTYTSSLYSQILKHVREKHPSSKPDDETTVFTNEVFLNSLEAESADILVCGACGFESGDKQLFTKHVVDEHSQN